MLVDAAGADKGFGVLDEPEMVSRLVAVTFAWGGRVHPRPEAPGFLASSSLRWATLSTESVIWVVFVRKNKTKNREPRKTFVYWV